MKNRSPYATIVCVLAVTVSFASAATAAMSAAPAYDLFIATDDLNMNLRVLRLGVELYDDESDPRSTLISRNILLERKCSGR